MTIKLDAPLAWTKANAAEIKMLLSLQGNILKPHGRDHTANIFFTLDPAKAADSKRMLRALANYHITSAYRQLLDTKTYQETKKGGGPFAHISLSFKGYEALGLETSAPADRDFRDGMKIAASLAALSDPPLNEWEEPFRLDLHGIVIAAHETDGLCAAFAGALKEMIEDAGGTVQHVQHGRALRSAAGEGIEHFGYVDGRSQPLMLVEDIEKEARTAGISEWDPAFPLSAALLDDPGVSDNVSFGSLFIYRKLEQTVKAFKTREQSIAEMLNLTNKARELAGAMIVGRFEDGTPVTMSDKAENKEPPNNFNYDADPGLRCPFHGHIRKVNPRGAGGAETQAKERLHIMPRRGIPFEDKKRVTHPSELPESKNMAEFLSKVAPLLPVDGVGLQFMAYNQDIARQFKFTQKIWANNPDFPLAPSGKHGIDPIIGQGANAEGDQQMREVWDDNSSTMIDTPFDGFVKMKGGEYFFSPSLTFLKGL